MTIKSFCIRIAESSDFDMLAAYEKNIAYSTVFAINCNYFTLEISGN